MSEELYEGSPAIQVDAKSYCVFMYIGGSGQKLRNKFFARSSKIRH